MFNRISKIKDKNVTGEFSDLQQLVDYIKDPNSEIVTRVQSLRIIGKGNAGYDLLKHTLPCFIPNFTFKDYVVKRNILKPTGYLYLDIDGVDDFEFNKTYVCAYWKSVSASGYGLMVKVNGLTVDNINAVAKEIASSLEIPLDKGALNYDRCNVLSYDPNAYYNDNVEVFEADEIMGQVAKEITQVEALFEKNSYYNVNKTNLLTLHRNGSGFRFSDLAEKTAGLTMVYDKNGVMDLRENRIPIQQLYLPPVIRHGGRNSILSSFAIGFLSLNPDLDKDVFFRYIYQFNLDRCVPPFSPAEIRIMTDGIFSKKDSYSVTPNRNRRFLYDPNKQWEKYEKNALTCEIIAKDKVKESCETIKSSILYLIGECQRYWKSDVKRLTGKHADTIAKHYNKVLGEVQVDMLWKHFVWKMKVDKPFMGFVFQDKFYMSELVKETGLQPLKPSWEQSAELFDKLESPIFSVSP